MLRFLKACDTCFFRILAGLCATLLGVMLISIGLQIVMRYGFNAPLVWSEELARFTMVWLALLASALAMRRAQHIALTGLIPIPARLDPALRALTALASIAILLILTDLGWELAQRTMRQRSPALGIPMGYMYAAIPVSAILMIVGQALAWLTATGQAGESAPTEAGAPSSPPAAADPVDGPAADRPRLYAVGGGPSKEIT